MEFSAVFFIIGFNTECWLYTLLGYGIIWMKVCREVIHMENVYKGLGHTGFIMMLIFGGVFLLRWFIHDEILLDQLIGFSVGIVMVISSVFIQKYSKELQVEEKY